MQNMVAPLCEVLSAEVDAHQELYVLSQSKKEAIIHNNISELDDIVKREQLHLTQVQDCERKRRAAVLALAVRLNRPAETITVVDFIEAATPAEAEQLSQTNEKLAGLLLRQKEINELNRRLIESRLEFINYTLSTVAQQDDPSQIYGKPNRGQDGGKVTKLNMIDRKV